MQILNYGNQNRIRITMILILILREKTRQETFFMNSASFWGSWKSMSWIFFKFFTQLTYFERTINPKFQTPGTSGY